MTFRINNTFLVKHMLNVILKLAHPVRIGLYAAVIVNHTDIKPTYVSNES